MKKLTQIGKVTILTFCLVIFSLNFHQVLNAQYPCEIEAQKSCEFWAESDCWEQCDIQEQGDCEYVDFTRGSCDWDICQQWYEIECTNGSIGEYGPYDCCNGCPIK